MQMTPPESYRRLSTAKIRRYLRCFPERFHDSLRQIRYLAMIIDYCLRWAR